MYALIYFLMSFAGRTNVSSLSKYVNYINLVTNTMFKQSIYTELNHDLKQG
mgnify:CR=1 FL=1